MSKPLWERRKLLESHMTEVGNTIKFSELKKIGSPAELKKMISSAISQGLEGLVLKDRKSTYDPGKRHWLKVKKDYLDDGAMADTADLVVLGAWYGTGLDTNSIFFCFLFCKRSLICLEGKANQ